MEGVLAHTILISIAAVLVPHKLSLEFEVSRMHVARHKAASALTDASQEADLHR